MTLEDKRFAGIGRAGFNAKKGVGRYLRRIGIDPSRISQGRSFDEETERVVRSVEPFTITSPERIAAVCTAGGTSPTTGFPAPSSSVVSGGVVPTMAAALTLVAQENTERELFLYDTYTGT